MVTMCHFDGYFADLPDQELENMDGASQNKPEVTYHR